MFTKRWRLSEPEHAVQVDRAVRIPMSDGIELDADVYRPAGTERCPVIVGLHGYSKAKQVTPSMPVAMGAGRNGEVEAGDPVFFARRGYAHVIVNARGTGASAGVFNYQGPVETRDGAEVVEWAARQPWCDGNVGLAGQSYFSIMALRVAAARPPSLKAIYSPWGRTSSYHGYYLGGILSARMLSHWPLTLDNLRYESLGEEYLGPEEFSARLERARRDPELLSVPTLAAALAERRTPAQKLMVDFIVHPFATEPFWTDRDADVSAIEVPCVLGACWGSYGLHLSGSLLDFEQLRAPGQLLVGPPIYLDRPIYQLAYDQLRWFDQWLKGIESGLEAEPRVRVFVPGKGEWLEREEWPFPETRWTRFNLHAGGLLSEHEFFPDEGATSFEDTYNQRGSLTFTTPKLVESTTLVGPARLELFASTTDDEVLWFASLWDVPPDGEPELLTRGWLRGTLRAIDEDRSTGWHAHHPFAERTPVQPGEIHRYTINLVATARHLPPGHRIALKLACSDHEPVVGVGGMMGSGRLTRPQPAWLTVHHDYQHPSCVHLPVVSGNIVGTFMSGGDPAIRVAA